MEVVRNLLSKKQQSISLLLKEELLLTFTRDDKMELKTITVG